MTEDQVNQLLDKGLRLRQNGDFVAVQIGGKDIIGFRDKNNLINYLNKYVDYIPFLEDSEAFTPLEIGQLVALI